MQKSQHFHVQRVIGHRSCAVLRLHEIEAYDEGIGRSHLEAQQGLRENGFPGKCAKDLVQVANFDVAGRRFPRFATVFAVPAQRFRLEPVVVDSLEPVSYRYLALYEIEGDTATLLAEMEKRRLGTVDSYAARKAIDSSGPGLPGWWDRVRFASWNCIALGERVTADSPATS